MVKLQVCDFPAEKGANFMRELTTIPMTELTDAELETVSGGSLPPHLVEGNGKDNFHAHSPFTPAEDNGFNGNGAFIVSPV
jgi:bacteriocin-like protein